LEFSLASMNRNRGIGKAPWFFRIFHAVSLPQASRESQAPNWD
jgi:hypothetical protein